MTTEEIFSCILGNWELGRNVSDFLSRRSSIPSVEELMTIKGVGESTANKIIACCELSAHYPIGGSIRRVYQPEDLIPHVADMKYRAQEHFLAVSLDASNGIISIDEATKGTLSNVVVGAREAFRAAIKNNAKSVIFVHNHPSGLNEPSDKDWALTRTLCAAGKILEITVVDHIIVSRTGFTSMCRLCPDVFESTKTALSA